MLTLSTLPCVIYFLFMLFVFLLTSIHSCIFLFLLFFSSCWFFILYLYLLLFCFFFFFKQKTAYEMRISDWSSDVCSSDLASFLPPFRCGAKSSWLKPLLQVPQGVRRRRQALESRVHARPTAHHDFNAHQSPFRYLDRAQVRRHLGVAPPPLGHHRPAGETARRRKRRARAGGGLGALGRHQRAAGDRRRRARSRRADLGAGRAPRSVRARTRPRSGAGDRRAPGHAARTGRRRTCGVAPAGLAGRRAGAG